VRRLDAHVDVDVSLGVPRRQRGGADVMDLGVNEDVSEVVLELPDDAPGGRRYLLNID
jgi:hypothetical protein